MRLCGPTRSEVDNETTRTQPPNHDAQIPKMGSIIHHILYLLCRLRASSRHLAYSSHRYKCNRHPWALEALVPPLLDKKSATHDDGVCSLPPVMAAFIAPFNPLSLLVLKFRDRSVAVFRDPCLGHEVSSHPRHHPRPPSPPVLFSLLVVLSLIALYH
jgi:hypothetical protein